MDTHGAADDRAYRAPGGPAPKGRRAWSLILAAAALALLVIASAAAGMQWTYSSPVTTIAVMGMAVAATGLAWWLLPSRLRPRGVVVFLLACVASYGFVQFGRATDWSGFLDHSILTPPGGEIDEFSTWTFGVLGAVGLAIFVRVVTWWLGRRSISDRDG